MAKISAYELLSVSERASDEEIRTAFLTKAKLHHPDRGGKAEDFLNMKRAFEILSDAKQRELMGRHEVFSKPLMRLQPSTMNSSLDQLLRNLDTLKDRLGDANGGSL